MKEMHELSGMDNPIGSGSRACDELKLSVEMELATEQKLQAVPLPQSAAAAQQPKPLAMPAPAERVARASAAPIADDLSIPQTAIIETRPIVDVVDKADVISTEAISTAAAFDYDPGPGAIVTDATIGLPSTPQVEILEEPADAVIEAELICVEDESGVIEVLEPFVIDEGNV